MTIEAMPTAMAERIKKRTLAAVAARWPKANGQRIIAIGRSEAGQPFKVTTPPDWPTDDEIEAICAPTRYDKFASAIIALMDPEDYELYSMEAELATRQEERMPQAY